MDVMLNCRCTDLVVIPTPRGIMNDPRLPTRVFLSNTMRSALSALYDGRTCDVDDRPKYVTIQTMRGLQRRGMVTYENDRWVLTPLGKENAE